MSLADGDMSTTQLVIASKDGDNAALGRLLEQYRGYLLMLAHRSLSEKLRRRVDPVDIVQVTFLEAKRDLAMFRGATPAEFSAWLRGMLKNNVATAVTRHVMTQKRSVTREVNANGPAGDDSGGAPWITQLPGSTTSPLGSCNQSRGSDRFTRGASPIARNPGGSHSVTLHGRSAIGGNC